MSLIEGVGDEVTVGVSVFVVLCLLLLAWLSTHTRDIPFVSIIVVELSQRRNRTRGITQPPASSTSSSATEELETAAQDGGDSELDVYSGDDGTSSNNNAHTGNDNGDKEEVVATSSVSKNAMPEAVPSFSTNETDASAAKNVEVDKLSLATAEVSDSGPHAGTSIEGNATTSQSQTPASPEAPTVLPPQCVEESSTATTIPEFRVKAGFSDELRRRRVAYFESGKESKTDKLSSMIGAPADSEQSSLGAQSQLDTHDGVSNTDRAFSSARMDAVPSSSGALSSDASLPLTGEASPVPSASLVEGHISPGEESMSGAAEAGPEDGVPSKAGEVTGGNVTQCTEDREQQIRVRLKYLNDTQRLVFTDPLETVGNFRRLHFSSELEDNKIVRFIFNGQDLRNDLSTLSAYNVADNSVIHCLITQSRQQEENIAAQQHVHEEDTQMGELIFPVFGLILGLVWYLRLTYKHYFNAMSTVSLAGVSFIYVLALFSSMRHRRRPHQHLD